MVCWEGPGASNECSHPLPDPTSTGHPGQDGSAPVVDQWLLLAWHVPGSLATSRAPALHNVPPLLGPRVGHARLTFRGALPATPRHIVVLLDLGRGSERFNPGQMGRVRSQLLWSAPYLCPGNRPGCQTSPWLREHRQVSASGTANFL